MEDNKQRNDVEVKHKISNKIVNIVLIALIVLCVITIFLRLFVFVRLEVQQESMMPTYRETELFWINKLLPVAKGSVIVFRDEQPDRLLVKRVIAVGGDKIFVTYSEGGYTVNVWDKDTRKVLREDYYSRNGSAVQIPLFADVGNLYGYNSLDYSYEVPLDYVYVMGDNRALSNDSRNFGCVSVEQYYGTAIT